VLDGEKLDAEKLKAISKWPNRLEQLSILLGQILSPGATLLSQLSSPGGALVSQIKEVEKKGEGKNGEGTSGEAKSEEPQAPPPA
jgi:large subunit ribosomal protein L10